jgi:ElaB/YqjD/DUF883 family membrane-anchored ribosome-binding protein
MREVISGLDTVVRQIEQLVRGAADGIGTQAGEMGEEVTARLRQARERLEQVQRDLQRDLRRTARQTDRYVRTNPWTAIAIVAAAALVIGALLAPRRD